MLRHLCLVLVLCVLLGALLVISGVGAPVAQAQESLAGAFTSCAAQTQIPEVECLALTALYTSTNGAGWTTKTNWLATDEPCGWYGVTCDAGHVSRIGLNENQLSGSIPADLGNLSNLQYLSLSDNQLSGSIPAELGNLGNLVWLYLYSSQLSGAIPPELGSLSHLQNLSLWGNQLSGSIPADLGKLSNLRSLSLASNQLTGSIPTALGNLGSLQGLLLGGNSLTGSIPADLGNLSNLQGLYLEYNQLTGGIPPELGVLSNLQQLTVYNNQLTGAIPAQLGNLGNLTLLYLGKNKLSGSIPTALGNLSNLMGLDLRYNQLSGDIPPSIVNLVKLEYYYTDLGFNALTASDPTLLAFLATKAPGWEQTQTVPPADVTAAPASSTSIQLTWTPILYTGDGGYYEVSYATTAGGPYTVHGPTADKYASGYLVEGLTAGTPYYFVVRTFTPAHGDQQNDLWSAYSAEATAATPSSGPYLRRVNCGGDAHTDTGGRIWSADRLFSAGSWGAAGGSKVTTTNPIDNTTDDPLYQSDRTWGASARPGYRFTVPNGAYEITFKFAETLKTAVAERKFTVRIEGIQVLTRYDIYSVAGASNKAVADRIFVVNVTDGELDIEFIKVIDNPKINAIQIKQLTSYELMVNCGGSLYTDSAGKNWRTDKNYGPGSWGYTGGFIRTTTAGIANTVDDTLYQSERQWSSTAAPGYRFAVPNGTYQVTFKFAETAYAVAGKRVFNVKLEGVTKLSNYDIFAAAGGKNIAAPDRTFTVQVTDGELTVDFIQVVGAPKVNAIRLKRTGD